MTQHIVIMGGGVGGLERGELQVALPDWAPIEPAFHIYYPGRRQRPPGLRELIDTLRLEVEG